MPLRACALEHRIIRTIDAIEVSRCASFLLKEYGIADGLYRVELGADACLENGDVEGERTRLRIVGRRPP
jgi:hypothetical protein